MLSREEFEEWLEEHGSEALDRTDLDQAALSKWIHVYAVALRLEASDNTDQNDDEEDEEVDEDGLRYYDED